MTRACGGCLRRSALVASLAGHIERAGAGDRRRRAPELLSLDDEQLVAAVGGRRGERILARVNALVPGELRSAVEAAGCWVVCRHDPRYPAALRDHGEQAPAALFGRGPRELLADLDPAGLVTVVGARRASAYGLGVAEELARGLAAAGIIVVSGLANGIDARAHRGCLSGGGRTVAVLAGGPDVPYPRRQAALYGRIVERGGAVVSELPPGSPCFRWGFPARNRTMAALAGITVVVEAAERSGSLITAAMALDLGRAVGAVPGPVTSSTSRGANQLLVEGADPIRDAQDVLDRLLGPGQAEVRGQGPPLEATLRQVLAQVERGHATCDAVAMATREPPGAVAAALARLELLGYLTCDGTGRCSRTTLLAP